MKTCAAGREHTCFYYTTLPPENSSDGAEGKQPGRPDLLLLETKKPRSPGVFLMIFRDFI